MPRGNLCPLRRNILGRLRKQVCYLLTLSSLKAVSVRDVISATNLMLALLRRVGNAVRLKILTALRRQLLILFTYFPSYGCMWCDSYEICQSQEDYCSICPEIASSRSSCESAGCTYCAASESCTAFEACQTCGSLIDEENCVSYYFKLNFVFDIHSAPLCQWCASTKTCQNTSEYTCASCDSVADALTCTSTEYSGCSWITSEEGKEICIYDCSTRSAADPDTFFATFVHPEQVAGAVTSVDTDTQGSKNTFSKHVLSLIDSYVAGYSNGPFMAKLDSSGNFLCGNTFDPATGHANSIVFDEDENLVYIVGDGYNVPLIMDNAPSGLLNTVSPRTQDAAILAYNATDCTLQWSIRWGASSNDETFTDIAIVPGKYR